MRIETIEEIKRKLFSGTLHDSSIERDIQRLQDKNLNESEKLNKIIKVAEERSPRLSLFNEFLSCNVLSQVINTKILPKYKKGIMSVAADAVLNEKFDIIKKMWFGYSDNLQPANMEEIQTDVSESQNVLVQGYYFMKHKDTGNNMVFGIDFIDGFMTGYIAMYTNEKDSSISSSVMRDILSWAKNNNFMKDKKISADGRFVKIDSVTIDDVILKDDIKRRIKSGTIDMLANMEKYRKNNLPIKRGILMEGEPGCQPAGELVLMADGTWSTVEDICVGDVIFSPQSDGAVVESKVLELKNYKSEIYTVKCGDSEYRVAGEHLLVVKTPNIKDEKLKRSISKITKSNPGTYANVTPVDILEGPERGKKYIYGFSSPAVDFAEREFEISPYHLGMLIGDGCFRNGVSITSCDEEIIEASKVLSESFGLELKKMSDKYSYRFSSGITGGKKNVLTEEIKKLGLYGLTSHNKFIPHDYFVSSTSQRLELLAGLIDTDGYKDKRNKSGSYEFCTTSERLAEDVYSICKSLGFGASIKDKNTSWTYGGSRRTGKAFRVSISPQDFCIPVRLERKVAGLRDSSWKNVRNKHLQVIEGGVVDTVYGFTLDSKSGWYITNNWQVTHNTGKTLVAKALANQVESTFIWVTADDIKYPEDVSYIYDMARELAPTIVLFEDIDYIGKDRGTYSEGSFDKITGELLNQMDGLQSNEGIITIASSNYPKSLDKALRNRPGRFDIRVKFELPDNELRHEMFQKFFGDIDISDISIEDMVDKSNGYTGAYIKELVVSTTMLAVSGDSVDADGRAIIKKEFFQEAFDQLEKSRKLDDEE